jgi:superfamily I DNA/RNA helicase
VVAAAGCGKTETVARRIERVLAGSADDPFRVLALSYTVRAADEMRDRFHLTLGDHSRRVDTETIHEFAWSLLRQYGTRIGLPVEPEVLTRDEDRVELLDRWLTMSGRPPLENPRAVLSTLDVARARGTDAPMLEEWRSALARAGAVDYQAMLDRAIELLGDEWVTRHFRGVYGHVVVDEAQNLTPSQYTLIASLIGPPPDPVLHVALVGDQRQSIVGFAGADPTLMSRFHQDYGGERVDLRTNYRSATSIINAGRAVSKALHADATSGETGVFAAQGSIEVEVLPNESVEAHSVAEWIARVLSEGLPRNAIAPGEPAEVQPEDIAVLARAAASLLGVRDALAARAIVSAVSSTEDDWVASAAAKGLVEVIAYRSAPDHRSTRRHIAALCGLTEFGSDDLAEVLGAASDPDVAQLAELTRYQDVGALVDGATRLTIDDPDWLGDLRQIEVAWDSFVDQTDAPNRTFGNFRQHVARCQRGDPNDPGVRLLTIHKAQGRQFKAVTIVACNDGQLPDFRAVSSDDIAAELRTFYVAISRASRCLLLTRSASRITRFGVRAVEPSPFLGLIEAS